MAAGEEELEPLVGDRRSRPRRPPWPPARRAGASSPRACDRGGCGRSRGCAPWSRATRAGWSGVPSRGQRSAAIANASWAASSARSKSPRKPIRLGEDAAPLVAEDLLEDRYHSSSGRTSIAPPSRAAGNARGELDRGVEVVGLEEEVAAQRLLDGDERAVGGQRLAVLDADGRGRLGRLHPGSGGHARRLVDRLVVGVDRLLLVLREARPLLGVPGSGVSPWWISSMYFMAPPCPNGRL